MYIQLRQRIKASAILKGQNAESLIRLRRIISYMVMYPIAYVVLSLPLAAGRMSTAQGHTPSVVYFCVAGGMITSSGFVDVLMYTFTRRTLIMDSEHRSDNRSNPEPSHHYNHRSNHIATVTAMVTADNKHYDKGILSRFHGRSAGNRKRNSQNLTSINRDYHSTDNIIDHDHDQHHHTTTVELADLGQVYQKTTTIEITSEPTNPFKAPSEVSERTLGEGNPERVSLSSNNPNGTRDSIEKPKLAWAKHNGR
jgi:hypothetical protein